jgi:hypothetical protein
MTDMDPRLAGPSELITHRDKDHKSNQHNSAQKCQRRRALPGKASVLEAYIGQMQGATDGGIT